MSLIFIDVLTKEIKKIQRHRPCSVAEPQKYKKIIFKQFFINNKGSKKASHPSLQVFIVS
jgi:hypothetical protein